MDMDLLWSGVLTVLLSVGGFFVRSLYNELQRVQILLNRTREEIAKEYVTKQEHCADMDRLITSMGDIGVKLDRIIDNQIWDGVTERRKS